MKHFLLLNIGNTHTQYCYADAAGEISGDIAVIDTAAWMLDLTRLPQQANAVAVWIACVVPQARKILEESGFYQNLHAVDAVSAAAAGLDFSLVDTSTLGADRIANAAALLDGALPAACFDCGTAVTLEIVDKKKRFAGGAIMPGRKLMRKSLAVGTAALPELPFSEAVPENPGCNTREALALGIDRGIVGMVREMLGIAKRSGAVRLLAVGGDAEFFSRALPQLECGGNEFTLRGISIIAAKHAV